MLQKCKNRGKWNGECQAAEAKIIKINEVHEEEEEKS